ncbi:EKC/KEOPS complex subunit GON7-like [Eleutherodactylus coqui]|uniref:EKC/KEOPS complex subunit GON7-like n=1 Tax=Eleutherodactylus coqui TaxID=57060 RepID=UPI0034622785
MELSAELTGRDGCSRPFRVTCEGTLRGLQGGLERLQKEVSAELSGLVEQEKGAGAAHSADIEEEDDNEDDEDDDDDDEDDSSKNGTLSSSPPTKRIKAK